MPRTTAGHRYPHVSSTARPHDHAMCKVIEAIVKRAVSGAEPWGTVHDLPPVAAEDRAHAFRNRLFNARNCGQLADRYGPLSVSVRYRHPDGELRNKRAPGGRGYVLAVAVYPRDAARAEITRRVGDGQRLAYNPWRRK